MQTYALTPAGCRSCLSHYAVCTANDVSCDAEVLALCPAPRKQKLGPAQELSAGEARPLLAVCEGADGVRCGRPTPELRDQEAIDMADASHQWHLG